jgi:hypothetical protein
MRTGGRGDALHPGAAWSELGLIVASDNFTDVERLVAIVRVRSGNFRLIHRVLEINP